jgi:anthranilate synthase/indole-3-glycerol phosphate synthase/phosphoribosylanthranilate isomerase
MATNKESILDAIVKQRLLDICDSKAKKSLADLQTEVRAQQEREELFGPQINFYERLKENAANNLLSVMAEMKRASPSKGDIAPGIVASEQGLQYADAGVEVISCLTEPKWFKGTLEDLKNIRESLWKREQNERTTKGRFSKRIMVEWLNFS